MHLGRYKLVAFLNPLIEGRAFLVPLYSDGEGYVTQLLDNSGRIAAFERVISNAPVIDYRQSGVVRGIGDHGLLAYAFSESDVAVGTESELREQFLPRLVGDPTLLRDFSAVFGEEGLQAVSSFVDQWAQQQRLTPASVVLASAKASMSSLIAAVSRWDGSATKASSKSADWLARLRIREVALMGLITLTAVFANLPNDYVEDTLRISRGSLLAVLAASVIVGLFLYLKFGLFVVVLLLIVGANMPEQIADGLNVSREPIILALVALVGLGLINYVVEVLPTGLRRRSKQASPEGTRALFYAIEKNSLVYAQKVLSMNFDPNLPHDNGYTALAYAAMKGSVSMVELLIENGADPDQLTAHGDTTVELALRMGHIEVANLLKSSRQKVHGEQTRKALVGAKTA